MYTIEANNYAGSNYRIEFARLGDDANFVYAKTTPINYRYKIELPSTAYGSLPHARSAVYHESSPDDKDTLYLCTGEKYTGSNPSIPKAHFYRVILTNEVYTSSEMHEYGHFAMCGSTHAVSSTQAIFAITETKESGAPSYTGAPYVKLITLTFSTGAFSVLKQSSAFSSVDYWKSSDSEYGLVFFNLVSDSNVQENLYIATIGEGLDNTGQSLAYKIGIITTTENRSSTFGTASNGVSINGEAGAASGTLSSSVRSGSLAPDPGGVSHVLTDLNTGS